MMTEEFSFSTEDTESSTMIGVSRVTLTQGSIRLGRAKASLKHREGVPKMTSGLWSIAAARHSACLTVLETQPT